MSMTTIRRAGLGTASIVALVVGFAAGTTPAQAQPLPIFSGGATLPQNVYRQLFNCYGQILSTNGRQNPACTNPFDTPRLFVYAPRGSSAGINTWLRDDPTRMGVPSDAVAIPLETSSPADNGVTAFEQIPAGSADYPLGLAVFSTAREGYPNHHWSGSDAIVPQTDRDGVNDRSFDCFQGRPGADASCRFGNFDGGAGGLDPIQTKTGPGYQVPTVVTTVNLPFNTPGQGSLRLTRVAYCGIWQGTINTWDNPAIRSANPGFNPPAGQPIIRFVREDGSGTTFLFTNALERSCDGAGGRVNYTRGAGELASWPARNFYLAPGNESVAAGVARTPWSIGYTTNESTIPAVTSLTIPETFTVNDRDGSTPAITVGAGTVPARQRAAVQNNAASPEFVFPAPSSARIAMSSRTPPAPADRDDPAIWGARGFNPFPTTAGSYPFVGFTYYLGYTCYADTGVARALRGFWGIFTATTGTPAPSQLQGIVSNLQFGSLPNEWRLAVRDTVTQNAATRIGGVTEPTSSGNRTCTSPIGNLPRRIGA